MRCLLAVAVIPGLLHAQEGTDIFVARVTGSGTSIQVSVPSNVTQRAGYDNQPSFTPDGRAFLFTSIRDDEQADTYRFDVERRTITRLTHTTESEYSPTVMPGGTHFSAVRVEADSTQRLWKFRIDGSAAELVLEDVKPIGYHAWANAYTLGLFVLGNPATLRIADTRTGAADIVVQDIGRSLHPVPGREAISFLHQSGPEPYYIKTIDIESRTIRLVAPALSGNEFYAWLPDATLIMGVGSRLFTWARDAGRWVELADLSSHGVTGISRLAVSPDGRRLAIVAADGGR
jgi:Tol biopolymer transport system component